MRRPVLTFRCASRRERGVFHTVRVENDEVLCTCAGTHWCSHIEATLVDGERNMIPFEEWDTADQAQRFLAGRLRPPSAWKATWRDDRVWRGLAAPRQTPIQRALAEGRPTICFIGVGELGNRQDYAEEAADLGWLVLESPQELTTLVVYNPLSFDTQRALAARRLGLPMLSFEDWHAAAYDFTDAVLDALDRTRPCPTDQLAA